MSRMSKVRTIATAVLLLALAGPPSGASAQGGCVSPGEGQQMVAQGQVRPFPDAFRGAGFTADQLVDQPQLCSAGGGWVYRVRVLQGGQVSTVDIPAG
jgi:hypothetical protein